jgi:CheY-like chemotaxis protein
VVDSKLGEGTTVRVYLPCSAETAETSPAKDLQDSIATGSETILVVEDNELARDVTVQFLTQSGYRVLTARDGSEALVISKRHRGGIHLLLTDVVMPCMSGPELAQKLARPCPRMRTLYMTGYSDANNFNRCKITKNTALLLKPFLRKELMGKVREVLAGAHEDRVVSK